MEQHWDVRSDGVVLSADLINEAGTCIATVSAGMWDPAIRAWGCGDLPQHLKDAVNGCHDPNMVASVRFVMRRVEAAIGIPYEVPIHDNRDQCA